ncbi:MAG TPA: type II 3-dehydroquinate dehydratase [Candidatus Dormibacteraeota bacterium]|jgi:3-dehydroquinate dehydratase-2|nr:type II 3-dehydroquinate dehydratase [Candidatus Dormibacteraeota bacterium]
MKLLLLNGPNLNLLGTRQPELYGITTLRDIVEDLRRRADDRGASLRDLQSNHEGALIDFLQEHADADGGIINPGGLAHTSIVLRDAVAACAYPIVEVHITDITRREPFRRSTYLADVVAHAVIGKGVAGYVEAMDWLLDHLQTGRT